MARQGRRISGTGIYHVLQRGVNQQRIFEQAEDYIHFLDCLYEVKKLTGLTLYAYCLMGNHIHILLKEGTEPLSMILRRLGTRYATWFNKKYGRSGHLFQDRYKSEPVETDEYFLSVVIYIYQNPVKAGICRFSTEYEWSSRRFLDKVSGLIDLAELTAITSAADIKQKEQELTDKDIEALETLEPMTPSRKVYSDKDAVFIMRQLSGVRNVSEFQRLPEGEQRALVVKMRKEQIPFRQISRVTGMSKGIIERWCRMTNVTSKVAEQDTKDRP